MVKVFAHIALIFVFSAGLYADVSTALETVTGDATYYGGRFHGRKTASGITFDKNSSSMAAHRTWPFGTVVRVTNLSNGKSVEAVIVDRGPYGRNRRRGVIIDISEAAARELGMIRAGKVRVKIEVLKWGEEDAQENEEE